MPSECNHPLHRCGGLSCHCECVAAVWLHVRVCAYKALYSVFVTHRHKVVQQRVDDGIEVEEHRRHKVKILDEEVVELRVCVVRVSLVEHIVQVVHWHHSVWNNACSGKPSMVDTLRSYGHHGCCSDPSANISRDFVPVSQRIILDICGMWYVGGQHITALCSLLGVCMSLEAR